MSSLPKFLYHGTRATHLDSILANDLMPRGESGNSQWTHSVESRPDAVYLTTAYPLHFAANAQSEGDLLIVEVDTARLDPYRLIADEDALAQSQDAPASSREDLEEKTRYFRERSHEYSAEESLSVLGTCAHLGPVPRRALRRAARIPLADIGKLILGGFDPTVTPINYSLFGADYEKSVAWLFGDTDVCAINPRMPRFSFEVITMESAA
jgi:hypothetical protein